jgi:hypothetical protein
LNLECDKPLSNFGFNMNLRRYTKVLTPEPEAEEEEEAAADDALDISMAASDILDVEMADLGDIEISAEDQEKIVKMQASARGYMVGGPVDIARHVIVIVIARVLNARFVRLIRVLVGRFRYIAWVKRPYRVAGKASALRARKRASG